MFTFLKYHKKEITFYFLRRVRPSNPLFCFVTENISTVVSNCRGVNNNYFFLYYFSSFFLYIFIPQFVFSSF